jgi:HAD superfamily hydrolase (TIGR01549 family)
MGVSMTKVILFDFWGTLVENGVWSPIKQVQDLLDIRMPFSAYVVRMERAMMSQEFDSLKEAFVAVCEEFNIEAKEHSIEKLVGMWNKSWMLAKPYSETIEELKKLQENYRVVLISNTDSFSITQVMEKFNLSELFEKKFLSYQLGLLKTDSAFLEKVVKELKVGKEDCILIGDSIQSDIKAADQAGIKSILIDRRNSREYSPKITSLKEVGAMLTKND